MNCSSHLCDYLLFPCTKRNGRGARGLKCPPFSFLPCSLCLSLFPFPWSSVPCPCLDVRRQRFVRRTSRLERQQDHVCHDRRALEHVVSDRIGDRIGHRGESG